MIDALLCTALHCMSRLIREEAGDEGEKVKRHTRQDGEGRDQSSTSRTDLRSQQRQELQDKMSKVLQRQQEVAAPPKLAGTFADPVWGRFMPHQMLMGRVIGFAH